MSKIEFDAEQRAILSQKLKTYLNDELGQDLGQFDSEFLLDFISDTIGPHYYNKGLADAAAVISTKFEDINHALYEIEVPCN